SDTSIIITNTGTSIMSITSVLSDNSQFSVSPTTATIAVSATKKFTVYFTPTSIGLKTGEIIFNHDATGSPDTIIVSGTGVLPSFSSSPSSLAFGNVVINTPKVDSITVTNNGGATMLIDSIVSVNSVDYGISQSSAVIGAFSSKKFYITFTPLSAGSKPNTFTFYHNGSPSSNQITVSGFCIQPLFSPSPTTLSFGGIIILDSTKTDSITVSNTGNSTLSISNITSSNNTDFSISPTSGSVSPSESKKFGVTFHPSTVGLKTGSIIFTHDAAGSPDTVIVNGQGDRRVFTLSATSKSYGDVLTGQPKVDSVIVTNDGTVSMTVSSVTSSRATFTVNPTSAIITAGSSKSFHITFSPVDSGTVYGIIIFNHNAPTNPDTVSVSGRGIAPIAQFSTASISFGNVAVNTTKKDSVTVTNSGGAPLIIEAVSSSREKFTVTPIDAVMQPLESKKFYVTFAPTDTGENTGNIVFTHNASGSPTNVAVDGHAIAPFFTSTPDSLDFGDVSVNSSHEDTITVWNTGSDLLSINSVTTDDGQFTVSSDKEDVAPGDSVQFIITFQPLLPIGIKRANVIFAHNALALPTKIPVKGNAIYPIFSADTNFLNFDTVYLHTPKTLDVVVTNIGSSPLTIFEINPIQTGHPISEFSTDFSSERVIETASGITVQVTFDPSGIGLSTAKLLFSHNGSLRPDTVRLSALTVDTSRYRSFDATLLALDRDNKGGLGRAVLAKADRALFKYTIKNTLLNAKILIVEFNAVIDTVGGSKVTSVPPADSAIAFKPKPDAKVTNLKRWTLYYPTPIDTGATVEITAVGKKASLIKVKKHSWSSDPLTNLGKKTAVSLVSNVLGLPRPNRINVLKRAFDGGGFNSTVGLLVGLNRQIDSPAYYGWVLIDNEKQTLVSLGNKAGKLHTKVPRGFDKLDVGKGNNPFIGPKGILLNRFHDNRLFANMVALKLNIVASAMGVNPVGFGELKYDDGTNNPLVNGKTIAHISRMADTMMSGYYVFDSTANARVHKFADTSVFKILDSAVYKINNSFEGVIDTISFSSGLRLKGTRSISEVPYLIPSGLKPTIITPLENNWVLPSSPVLEQNYPNPFNPRTTIQFYLLEPSVITLKVYNILGQEVATLFDNEEVLDGYTDVEFDASSLSSGVYFYRLTLNDGSFTKMKKLMLIK
ncbi:MAG: choice-of-anchor D domain-containing protein, partial [Ignavibacteriales bacterium]|nr:choice-of-anchor D domain-containing protein [Ignavibacteriales bacterium]